jgi:hypothetical protein
MRSAARRNSGAIPALSQDSTGTARRDFVLAGGACGSFCDARILHQTLFGFRDAA